MPGRSRPLLIRDMRQSGLARKHYPAALGPGAMCCDVRHDRAQRADLGELGALAVELAVEAGRAGPGLAGRRVSRSTPSRPRPTWSPRSTAGSRAGSPTSCAGAAPTTASSARKARRRGRPVRPVRWLVDPIDGTVNFALGLPHYGVSIAAEVDGQVVAGCVVNPASGRRLPGRARRRAPTSSRGWPAPTPARLRRARARSRSSGPWSAPASATTPRAGPGRARSWRTAAADRRHPAGRRGQPGPVRGRRRLARRPLRGRPEHWDYAAGLLIATEAGCVSSGLRGRPAGEHFCAVAGPRPGAGPVRPARPSSTPTGCSS